MASYIDYMYKFEISSLKGYLGDDIVNTLIEWTPNGDTLLTRGRLIGMINSVYGMNIFKNRKFRKELLLSMKEEDILEIRDECLVGKEKEEKCLVTLVEIISNKSWGKNSTSRYLAYKWNLEENIFEKDAENSMEPINKIISEDRFYELLDYQYYIKQRILSILNSEIPLERLLVHMPTGTGKTKTSMHTIVNYMQFTLNKQGIVIWIAHTTELLQQAYETFVNVWQHLGEGEITAYKLWGNNSIIDLEMDLNGIAFCGLAKLMSIAKSNSVLFEKLRKDCRLIVFDEAHKAAATETRTVIEGLMNMKEGVNNRALIGLSATPGRTTQSSIDNGLLVNMFGNRLIYIDPDILNQINYGKLKALNISAETNIIHYFQEQRILAKLIVEKLEYKTEFTEAELEELSKDLDEIGFEDVTDKQLKILAKNKDRNLCIMKKLRELYTENTPTIVFACSVDHAKMLSTMLSLENIPNSLILGEMNPIDRKKAIDEFKNRKSNVNIIINYEVLTTGFDSKNIKCVFITRPTKSVVMYSQMLGRGLRGPLMGGNENCLLVDIEDNISTFDNENAFSHFDDYWKA